MNYYYIGLKVDSPEREQAFLFRDSLLRELNITTNGRMFVEPYSNLLQNEKFIRLLDYMKPCDTLILHDMTRSVHNVYNELELLRVLYDKHLHVINMGFPRVNTVDFPFLYEELSEILVLLQNYTVFLYHVYMRTLHEFDITQVESIYDIDKEFASYITHTIRNELYSYGITTTVTEFIEAITMPESQEYVRQFMNLKANYPFKDNYDSLQLFNEYLRCIK